MASTRLFLVALCSFFAAAVIAAPSTVKIRSGLCGASASLTTSGVPIVFDGKTYVLTSSWGILEEATGVCHEITDGKGATYQGALAALDWALGYALLEAPGLTVTEDFVSASALPTAGDLEIQGYSTAGTAETKHGRIVASKSSRHHFPSLDYSFEVLADRLPSAFIGAPVYGKSLEGILSAQWLEIVAGTYSKIREWKTGSTETPNHFFVIPLALIRANLQNGLPKRTTFQPASTKLGDRSILFTGAYKFGLKCPVGAGLPPADGVGPIGGGDGVGVGGSMKGAETCTASLSKQKEITLATPKFLPHAFVKDLTTPLSSGGVLDFPFLSTRSAGTKLARVPFFSVPHFFNELSHGKRNWVLVPATKAPLTGGTLFEELLAENAKLKDLLLQTYSLITAREDDRDDYRVLYTHAVVLESLNWKLVKWADVQSLLTLVGHMDFVEGIQWKGALLRQQLADTIQRMDRIFMAVGGTL